MIFSENRFPLFRIMLQAPHSMWMVSRKATGGGPRHARAARLLPSFYNSVYFAMQSELGVRGRKGVQTEQMRDLDKALADIIAIRSQLAAGTAFAGYGPAAVAATAFVALVTAASQYFWLDDPTHHPLTFLCGWAAAALLSAAIIFIEMVARSRRHHSGLADAMIHQAVEQFLPAAVAGVLLAMVLWKFAPEALWLLPGLWQVLVSLGIFASVRSLPRTVAFAGAWYFVTGFTVLLLASQSHALSPWTMGLPFVIGQSLMATILYFASGERDAEE
jgi:hypothetical protein